MSPKNRTAPTARTARVDGAAVTFTETTLSARPHLADDSLERLTAAADRIRAGIDAIPGIHDRLLPIADGLALAEQASLASHCEHTVALATGILAELDTLAAPTYDGRPRAGRRRRTRIRDLRTSILERLSETTADLDMHSEFGITVTTDANTTETARLLTSVLDGLALVLRDLLDALDAANDAARPTRLELARRVTAFAATALTGIRLPTATPRPQLISSLSAAPAAPPAGRLLSRDLDASRV